MSILITNIKELLQVRNTPISKVSGIQMKELPTIKNAYILIEDDIIIAFGNMSDSPGISTDKTIDARGKLVLPTCCDSHNIGRQHV